MDLRRWERDLLLALLIAFVVHISLSHLDRHLDATSLTKEWCKEHEAFLYLLDSCSVNFSLWASVPSVLPFVFTLPGPAFLLMERLIPGAVPLDLLWGSSVASLAIIVSLDAKLLMSLFLPNWIMDRPFGSPKRSLGMPSGHAVATCVLLWLVHNHHLKKGNKASLIFDWLSRILLLFIPASRLLLGYHNYAQIVVGSLLGWSLTRCLFCVNSKKDGKLAIVASWAIVGLTLNNLFGKHHVLVWLASRMVTYAPLVINSRERRTYYPGALIESSSTKP